MRSDPEAIINAHLAYLEAGAKIIITSSYQASILGFRTLGIDKTHAEKLILKSVEIASEAVDRFLKTHPNHQRPQIAASIGPYGAYLADGSEYRGNYNISDGELFDFHISRIRLLDKSTADFLACETIPSFQEAGVLSRILENCKKKAWMTFSCMDEEHINDGTPITKCITLLKNNTSIFAAGVNCTNPQYISGLIRVIKSIRREKKVVVYPNSGEEYHSDSKSWSNAHTSGFALELAKEWLDLGADIIGGCCRVGKEEIKRIGEVISNY